LRGGSGATRLSRRGASSLDGSLIVRGLERGGAAITEPASEERESSWKVVGLMFRRDICVSLSRGYVKAGKTIRIVATLTPRKPALANIQQTPEVKFHTSRVSKYMFSIENDYFQASPKSKRRQV
jgi:hypothetical protein